MNITPDETNPILPAPGVSRNSATDAEASRSTDRLNDDGSTNCTPQGDLSENSRGTEALLRCKRSLTLGTYNVETLRSDHKAYELEMNCRQQDIQMHIALYMMTQLNSEE